MYHFHHTSRNHMKMSVCDCSIEEKNVSFAKATCCEIGVTSYDCELGVTYDAINHLCSYQSVS